MKVAILTEYYPPFSPGGAEFSIFYLTQKLISVGVEVVIITPSYRSDIPETKRMEYDIGSVKVIRFPYQLAKFSKFGIDPILINNPFFWIYSLFWSLLICSREDIDLIHVQSKFFVPTGVFLKYLLSKPLVITFREKLILCPYNYCLSNNKLKHCSLYEFVTKDYPWYLKNYVNGGLIKYVISFITGIYGWTLCRISSSLARLADQTICISQQDKKVFSENGWKNISVIYNSVDFPGIKKQHKTSKLILFAGRITMGKGAFMLIQAFENIFDQLSGYKLIFAGGYDNFGINKKIKKSVQLLGPIPHKDLLNLYSKVDLTVMPTITVEAFGRVALESISRGTPAVVTRVGGLPEVVNDGRDGYVVEPTPENLGKGILKAIKNNKLLRKNIIKDYQKLSQKFGTDNIQQYISLYRSLI